LFLVMALLAAYPAFAQDRGVGLPAFGSYTGSAMDSVNNQNLNVHTAFPILPPTGRAFGFGFSEVHDSEIWAPVPSGGTAAWTPNGGGWQMLSSGGTLSYAEADDTSTCSVTFDGHTYTPHNRLQTNFVFFDAQGTPHQFPGATALKNSCTNAVSGSSPVYSSDHTGYLLTPATYTVTGSNGAQFVSGAITDANGNYISQSYQNTQTQHVTIWTLTNGQTANQTVQGNSVTVTSGSITASVTSASYNVKTAFGCPNVSEFTGTIYLPSSITTASGLTYTLAYEPTPGYSGYFTGRLASITSSTGGVTTYTYTGNNGGINCADGTGLGLTEVVNDTINTSTRTYTRSGSTTTVTLPDGSTAVYTFDSLGRETSRKIYAGAPSGTPLRQVNTTFDANNFPTTSVTILEDGSTQSKQATTFDTFGNLTSLNEYDYGSGAPGALLRQTVTSFTSPGNNILNLPASVTIKDGPGNIKAQTNFTYDEGTPTSTSATQHISVSGPRGNLTTVSSLVSGSTYVNRSVAYYDTGEVKSATDSNSNATTYLYPSTHNTVGPTTVTNALSQSTSYNYDAASGLVTSVVDPNSKTISYSYDAAMRPTDIFYPDGGHTSYAYPSPHETDVYQQIDNTGRDEVVTKLTDALGRPSQTMLTSDPGGVDYVDTTYDNLGRVHTVTNPYRSTSDSTYGLTTYAYDALGRTTTVTEQDNTSQVSASYALNCTTATDEAGKKRKSCSDGLGRVTQVFEDPAGVNYETDYQYDTLDNLICAAQKGTNTGTFSNCASTPTSWRPRSFNYDALSRLTSSTNPESGTTSYTYDNNGNVLTKTSPKPNQTGALTVTATYAYDALNRLTQKSYTDGTPSAFYFYDQNSWWNISLTNTIGRLAYQGTFDNSTGHWVISSGMSYDSMGRIVNNLQCNIGCPNGPFPLGYGYDLAGDMTSSSNGVGVTFNQSFDAAGRPTQLTSSLVDATHPATLFSSPQYSPAGQLTGASLGNSTTPSFTFTNRGFLQHGSVASPVQTAAATPGTGSATVSGTEQSRLGPSQAGSGSVTINGWDQSYSYTVDPCSGYDPSSEDYLACWASYGPPYGPYQVYVYDSGTVYLTVNSVTCSTYYNSSDSSSTIASRLATAVNNCNSYVWASPSGATISLVARWGGAVTNYSLSTSASSSDTYDFPSPSFYGTPSGSNLTGGADGTPQYDYGYVWVTVNGAQCTASYGQGDNAAAVANRLSTQFASCPVSVNLAGNTLNLTATTTGSGTNYSLSGGSSSSNSFYPPSFSVGVSGSSLTGGRDATYQNQPFYTYDLGFAANGNVTSANDTFNGNWTYAYDGLNRLSTATQNGQPAYTYDYDPFGNRLNQKYNSSCTGGTASCLTVDNNNRVTGGTLTYDAAGNVIADPAHAHYYYDAENRLIQVDGSAGYCSTHSGTAATACYVYDAEGRRIAKTVGGITATYLYDLAGHPVTEVDSPGGWNRGEVYMGGMHLATYFGGTTYFNHADWLGTERVRTNVTASEVPNTGFESGTTGWNMLTGSSLVTDATRAHAGSKYVQLSAAVGSGSFVMTQNIAVHPGDHLTFGGWAYLESGSGGSPGWWLETMNASQNAVGWYGASPTPTTSSGWTFQSATYTVPPGIAYVSLYGNDYMPSSAVVLRVDDGFLTSNDGTNNLVCETITSLPFGDGQNSSGACNDASPMHFTGYQRDSEASLDFANARHYEYSLGRFMQPDPSNAGADPANPQSWNMYAYVNNSPLNFTDPAGMGICDTLGAEDCLMAMSQCQNSGGGSTCAAYDSTTNDCRISGVTTLCSIMATAINQGAGVTCSSLYAAGFTGGCNRYNVDSNDTVSIWISKGSFYEWADQSYKDHVDYFATNARLRLGRIDPDTALMDSILGRTGQLADSNLKSAIANMVIGDVLGGLSAGAASLESMEIAIGPGSPFHVAYGADGTWLNAVGSRFFQMRVSQYLASETATSAFLRFSVPVLNAAAVLATEGCSAWSCATAAASAFAKGWIPW